MLIERCQQRRALGAARHQIDKIDEVALPEQRPCPRVGFCADDVCAEELTTEVDQDRILLGETRRRPGVAHDIDDRGLKTMRGGGKLRRRP